MRRTKIIDFFIKYKEENNGVPPTIREITTEIGASSTSVTFYHLKKLEENGFLVKRRGVFDLNMGGWSLMSGDHIVTSDMV